MTLTQNFNISYFEQKDQIDHKVHTDRLRNDSATILNNAGQAVKTSCRNSLNLDKFNKFPSLLPSSFSYHIKFQVFHYQIRFLFSFKHVQHVQIWWGALISTIKYQYKISRLVVFIIIHLSGIILYISLETQLLQDVNSVSTNWNKYAFNK